jgi:tetratricopeptide (TPR) repeat protein
MSFFKKLFGKSTDPNPSSSQQERPAPAEQAATAEENFDREFLATVPRYISQAGAEVNLQMRHQETNEVMTFAAAFPEQFEAWKTVHSLADRRGIIYSILDNFLQKNMKLWQIVERFTDDRYPQRAQEIASEHAKPADLDSADFWAAAAKAELMLYSYEEAEKKARKALQLEPGNIRARLVLADVLHVTGKHEPAHALYNEILQARIPKDAAGTMTFAQLVGFDGDILPSPIYALAWLQSHPDITIDTWNWANEEFYYSPHFRTEFAYYLLRQKETMKGFVKLFTLAKEMPWFKEAVINSWQLLHQLGDNSPEEMAWLEGVMSSQNWDPNNFGQHQHKIKI